MSVEKSQSYYKIKRLCFKIYYLNKMNLLNSILIFHSNYKIMHEYLLKNLNLKTKDNFGVLKFII